MPDEYWLTWVWEQIDIYDGPEMFLQSFAGAPQHAALLYAVTFADSEVCNGGFKQLFHNSTGVLVPEAIRGFQTIGMPQAAMIFIVAAAKLGEPYPRDRTERQAKLVTTDDAVLYALDKRYYDVKDIESGGIEAAIESYANATGANDKPSGWKV